MYPLYGYELQVCHNKAMNYYGNYCGMNCMNCMNKKAELSIKQNKKTKTGFSICFFFFNSAQNVRGRDTTTILGWRTGNQRKQFGDVV